MSFKSGFESRERVAVQHSRWQWVPSPTSTLTLLKVINTPVV